MRCVNMKFSCAFLKILCSQKLIFPENVEKQDLFLSKVVAKENDGVPG